jgi:hypothetical protein
MTTFITFSISKGITMDLTPLRHIVARRRPQFNAHFALEGGYFPGMPFPALVLRAPILDRPTPQGITLSPERAGTNPPPAGGLGMSACRFMYRNLANQPDQISPSSARPGLVGMPVAKAQGAALAYAAGAHTGNQEQVFLVEIDSLAAGEAIGQATYRWRRGSATDWEETGVATGYNLLELADGVAVKWSAGSGTDFVLGDCWTILATRSQGAAALLDTDRDTAWQAMGVAEESLTMDLGQSALIQALVLSDHNLSAQATATLIAADNAGFDAPSLSRSLSITTPHLVHYLEHQARYWRLSLQDPGNTASGLSASTLYLGSIFQPSRMFSARYVRSLTAGRSTTSTDAGKTAGHATGLSQAWQVSFNGLTQDDMASLEEMYRAIHDPSSGRLTPLFFAPFVEQPGATIYCLPGETLSPSATHLGRYSLSLTLTEMVRTHV